MGTINWDNLADHAMRLLETVDLSALDEQTIDGLENAAAGLLPPQIAASRSRGASSPQASATPTPYAAATSDLGTRHSEFASRQVPAEPSGQASTGTGQVHEQVHEQVPQQVPQQVPAATEQVPQSESERTSPHLFQVPEKECAAQNKRTGNPCKARPSSSGYCVFHDPELTEAVNELRAKGGRAPRRVLVGEARKLDFQVMDRGGIQALIAQILRLQLLGVLTPRQASQTVKLVGHLVSNAREMSASDETLDTFETANRNLTDVTDTLATRLEMRDLTDRVNAIQDVGSKREEVLKANDRFGPRPTFRSVREYYR